MSATEKVTRDDVVLFHEGLPLDRGTVSAIRQALRSPDSQVSQWFREVSRSFAPPSDLCQSVVGKMNSILGRNPDVIPMAGRATAVLRYVRLAESLPNRGEKAAALTSSSGYVRREKDKIVIRSPAEDVPFGVIRLMAVPADLRKPEEVEAKSLGSRLVAMPRYSSKKGDFREAAVPVADLAVEIRPPAGLGFWFLPADDNNLAAFPRSEVQALYDSKTVTSHPELRARVKELLARLPGTR
jgi:hypothetical protein